MDPTDGMEGEGGEGGEEEGGESPSVEGVLEEVMQWDCDGLDRVGSGGTVWTAVDASGWEWLYCRRRSQTLPLPHPLAWYGDQALHPPGSLAGVWLRTRGCFWVLQS